MSKDNRKGLSAVESQGSTAVADQPVAQVAQPEVAQPTAQAEVAQPNHVIVYRRDHPGGGALGRCSYGIAGVPGIVVFDKSLFPDGVPPASITLDCVMVSPRTRVVTAKAELAAQKAAEKATKAAERIAAAAAKAAEKAAKSEEAVKRAQERIAAAQAATAKAATPAS